MTSSFHLWSHSTSCVDLSPVSFPRAAVFHWTLERICCGTNSKITCCSGTSDPFISKRVVLFLLGFLPSACVRICTPYEVEISRIGWVRSKPDPGFWVELSQLYSQNDSWFSKVDWDHTVHIGSSQWDFSCFDEQFFFLDGVISQ